MVQVDLTNEEFEAVQGALEYLHDTNLSGSSEGYIRALESAMDKFLVEYTSQIKK